MSEIMNCPFCNGRAIMRERFINGVANVKHYRLECVDCHASFLNWNKNTSKAIAAWNRRAQPENEPCTDCTGIVYRQTASGKIIPADQKCAAATPPCYQPDGDGCAYQTYGDNDDEPIDKCKECPLCLVDKVRRAQPENEPLTNAQRIRGMSDEELSEFMDGCDAYHEHGTSMQWLPWLRQPSETEGKE